MVPELLSEVVEEGHFVVARLGGRLSPEQKSNPVGPVMFPKARYGCVHGVQQNVALSALPEREARWQSAPEA